MDKSRQQFEEWFAPQKEEMKRNGLGMISITRMHQRQLSAWQASRESLVNNLKPLVYASEKDISDLKIFTYLFTEKQSSDSVNIPLYKLD